jgi:mitogen-activated protein kinase organizer 1
MAMHDHHQDRNICLWNPLRGVLVKKYSGHGYEVRDVCVASDNSKFASCGGDKQVGSSFCVTLLLVT